MKAGLDQSRLSLQHQRIQLFLSVAQQQSMGDVCNADARVLCCIYSDLRNEVILKNASSILMPSQLGRTDLEIF